ncbi:hypothetical protein [Nocardia brasiliensis]|uniref:hypothetical protein n=1 Tax=Nocardia brasiliensis TaxID=37326 RepID=UPI0004A76303|nr:hypothetical protein [Nocardia brasiliensis]MBF6126724.1 hypothetical protein [Nocardia brasiliensis]MBF6546885.1 hypothetical protein [Nocardia brasiliensis]
MVSQDTIAQLRQDLTTASDAGDEAAVTRLRGELDEALNAQSSETEALDDPTATTEDPAAKMDYEGDTPN